jgi:cytochrome c
MRYYLNLFSISLTILLIGVPMIASAQSNSLLALDKGCYSCHGDPPRKNIPAFEQIASRYAQYQGQTNAAASLAEKLRAQHVFGGINAHEKLTQENALKLVQWIIEGAK